MMPVTIQKVIDIEASAASLWHYVATEAGLCQWWGMDIALEERLGGRCEERSVVQGRVCNFRGEVTAYDPPRHVALRLRNAEEQVGWPAWVTISLTLQEEQGRTRVALVHQAFAWVNEQAAIEQPIPLPAPITAPQAIWRGMQPQNGLGADAMPRIDQPFATQQPLFAIERNWVVPIESHWDERLQMLARMVTQKDEEP